MIVAFTARDVAEVRRKRPGDSLCLAKVPRSYCGPSPHLTQGKEYMILGIEHDAEGFPIFTIKDDINKERQLYYAYFGRTE